MERKKCIFLSRYSYLIYSVNLKLLSLNFSSPNLLSAPFFFFFIMFFKFCIVSVMPLICAPDMWVTWAEWFQSKPVITGLIVEHVHLSCSATLTPLYCISTQSMQLLDNLSALCCCEIVKNSGHRGSGQFELWPRFVPVSLWFMWKF